MLPSVCYSQRELPLCQPSTSAAKVPRHESKVLFRHPRCRSLQFARSRRVLVRADQATKETTNQPTNPAETTEKYGLEAGLWQVFRGKDANGVSRTDQAKDLLKTYGSAYLLTSISFAIVSFAACYALVSAGVDIGALLEKVGIQVNNASERVGTVAIAYAAHKALSPVRFPPTVALTPVVARLLGRKGSESPEGTTPPADVSSNGTNVQN